MGKPLARLRGLLPFQTVLGWALVAYLSWQVLLPMGGLLFSSFKTTRPGEEGFFDLSFTLSNYARAFRSDALWDASIHSVVLTVSAAAISTILGFTLAWITSRTKAIGRGIIGSVVLAQLAVPELLMPISWGLLSDPGTGVLNQWWRAVTGGDSALFNIYSMPGMIWVQALVMLPMVYIFSIPAISAIDRSLEEAAEVAGASMRHVMWDVVRKLAAPALLATLILLMVRTWEAFEVPWLLGLRARILTYSTEIYFRTISPPTDAGLVSSFALPMLVVTIVLTVWYGRLNRVAGRYATIVGKSYRSQPFELGRAWRVGLGTMGMAAVAVGVALPLLMLVWLSLQPFPRLPSLDAFNSLTLDSYIGLLDNDNVVGAFINSSVVAIGTGFLVVFVALLSAYSVHRTKSVARYAVDRLTFSAVAIPNIVVGVAFLWIYRVLPIDLNGSRLGLILAYVTILLAIAARNISARAMQVGSEMDEAAIMSGASPIVVMRTIMIPLLGPALLGAFLWVMAASFRELPTALLLTNTDTQTVTALLAVEVSQGSATGMAAIAVVMIVFMAVIIGLSQIVAKRFGFERIF